MKPSASTRVRFGAFELDLTSGELRSLDGGNVKVLLREQAFQVLTMLVERRGKIVTREEIKKKLWPNDTVVEFDHSINATIKTLRRALGDSADNPQYIETLARRGYRLMMAAEWLESTAGIPRDEGPSAPVFPDSGGLIGKKVSHYRVLEAIGAGGMGMVYKAEDLKLGRSVALKFLPEEMASDAVALERFQREAQTASALNHPNICTIYEIEEHEGQPFIVMELLEGHTLRHRIAAAETKPLPLAELFDIALQICDGLQVAHEMGIIHRDVKPANVFLTRQGPVKILDFGLAKLAASRPAGEKDEREASTETAPPSPSSDKRVPHAERVQITLTSTGTAAGTAGYMSPEQVRKEELDARSDLFSFGIILYEMVTGRRAFTGASAEEIHDAILHQAPAPVRDVNSAAPRGLGAAISKALEKDRAQRYQSAAELRKDLARTRKQMQPARRRIRVSLAAAALLVVLAAGFWFYQDYRARVTLSADDTIVLADIHNQTSDPVFDDALNTALRYGLEQTPYLNILGVDKVLGTLALLKLAPTTKVTPEVARQVCLRTNSKFVIADSIADVGNRYRMELEAIDCQSGKDAARVREEVAERNQIVHVLGEAAAQLRRKLGEPAVSLAKFNQPLEEATSSSLEALQAGTLGYKHHIALDIQGAIPYYQHAIELDPNFALAYQALGAASGSVEAIKKAYELRSRMTEPVRLDAEYEYYTHITGEEEKACSVLWQTVHTFPRGVFAHVNLAVCLRLLGQPDRAADEAHEAARLQPTAYNYAMWILDSLAAERLNEAKAALDEATAHKFDNATLRSGRMQVAFLENDQRALQEQWNQDVGTPDALDSLLDQAFFENYYGRFRRARELMQQALAKAPSSASSATVEAAQWEAEVGNLARAKQMAASAIKTMPNRDEKLDLALAFARAGDVKQAQKLADDLDREFPLNTIIQNYSLPAIRAAMKLDANDPAGAIAILQPALKYDLSNYAFAFTSLYPAYLRGLAYLQLGQGQLAAAEFQKLLDHKGLVGHDMIGALSRLQLGRAYLKMGDQASARKWYEDFLGLWKDADPDIPIYRKAKAEYAELAKK